MFKAVCKGCCHRLGGQGVLPICVKRPVATSILRLRGRSSSSNSIESIAVASRDGVRKDLCLAHQDLRRVLECTQTFVKTLPRPHPRQTNPTLVPPPVVREETHVSLDYRTNLEPHKRQPRGKPMTNSPDPDVKALALV